MQRCVVESEVELKVLFLASEVVPFAKTGGLADVSGILPKFLHQMGVDVRVVMPRYFQIDPLRYGLEPVGGPLGVPMGVIEEQWCGVREGRLPGSEVPVYFIDHERYFGRASLYNDQDGAGFMDNDTRFVFFSRAALQMCKMIDWYPDVCHVNDWQTAAATIFLNTHYAHDPGFWATASVLTIHNMQHQGVYYSGLMDVLDVGWEHFTFTELEWSDQVNLLKGAIFHSQQFSTVSPGYAEEIQSEAYGAGLDSVVREKNWALRGILNGMDYDEWDPSIDALIPANYDADNMDGKAICKAALQQHFGLPVNPNIPVIGLVGRLVEQKGVDLLAEALPMILNLEVQVVLLGNGEPWTHFYFGDMKTAHPDKFNCHIGYSNELAHLIEAGSDFFLMPSRFEPCGLNQMYSLRYGTIPIVRAAGGLDDTVENLDDVNNTGTGFKFWSLTAQALFDTVGWALYTWYNRQDSIAALRKNGMARRFTWAHAATQYFAMYQEALRIKRG